MEDAWYTDEEILKLQIAENSKQIDELLKELKDSAIWLTLTGKDIQ
ncbi:MAG: hypothetical protein K0R50_3161 [Eubacterium sp.]|nr:hypothetical protein [Eubacterium sp.]